MTLDSKGKKPSALLVIAGATASGKTALALRLARVLKGEVLALDSVQVYRRFDIGSAKPSAQERSAAPHHLIDVLEPTEVVSAAWYVKMADEISERLLQSGKLPIVVGGTTMYLTGLLHGLVTQPEIPQAIREELRQKSAEELHAELTSVDPDSARSIAPRDKVRMVRALELFRSSGVAASVTRSEHGFSHERHRALIIVPTWPRDRLYERIDQRVAQMLALGLLDEVRSIVRMYGREIHPLRSLGYAQCLQVVEGQLPESELAAAIATATRRFAKRQLTYLRNEPRKRGWMVAPEQEPRLLKRPRVPGGKRQTSEFVDCCMTLTQPELVRRIQAELERGLSRTQVWFVDAQALGIA